MEGGQATTPCMGHVLSPTRLVRLPNADSDVGLSFAAAAIVRGDAVEVNMHCCSDARLLRMSMCSISEYGTIKLRHALNMTVYISFKIKVFRSGHVV